MIDTKTLEVGFDTSRTVDKGAPDFLLTTVLAIIEVPIYADIQDALTIQRYRKPGQAFLNAMFRSGC